MFPGRFRRKVEMALAGRTSVQLAVGTVPMLLIAAIVEGFVSPSDLLGLHKAVLGAVLAAAYGTYIYTLGHSRRLVRVH